MTSSRQTFAFARDGALPGSRYLYRVNRRTQTPVNLWLGAFVGYLLGPLAFAGPAAIGAIFSLGVGAQYGAYIIPIGSRLFFKNDFRPEPLSIATELCYRLDSRPLDDIHHYRVLLPLRTAPDSPNYVLPDCRAWWLAAGFSRPFSPPGRRWSSLV